MNQVQGSGTLGKASLILGIASAALVFGIGLCALIGLQQQWILTFGTLLFVCGASSAFLGLLGLLTGIGGLFERSTSRAVAAVGITASVIGMCLFFAVLAQFN